jgi:myosin heavy subunit
MLHFYDNKPTVDELMAKPNGLFHLLDEASKTSQGSDFILGRFKKKLYLCLRFSSCASYIQIFRIQYVSQNKGSSQ